MDRNEFLKKIAIIGIIYYLLIFSALTYSFASSVNFHPALGGYKIQNIKVYSPFDFLKWRVKYAKKRPTAIKKINNYFSLSHYLFLVLIMVIAKKKQEITVHGSARWATQSEIKKMDLYKNTGAVLGRDSRNNILHDNSDRHIFVAAPTRGGKGINTVVPTALDWNKSIVFNDIKGELWELTAGYRKNVLGQKVFMFCPTDTEGISCSYNPLDFIAIGTGHEFEDVSVISQTLIDTEGKGESDHWITSAINLINAVILHVKYANKNASLVDVVSFLSPSDTSLSNVLADILGVPREDEDGETGVSLRTGGGEIYYNEKGEERYSTFGYATFDHLQHYEDKDLFKKIYNYEGTERDVTCKLHPIVAKEFMSLFSTPDKERGSIISTANQKLKIFLDTIIASHIRHSDFTVKELLEDKCSLYLVTPPKSINRTRPILRLIFVQIVYGLTNRMKFNQKEDPSKNLFGLEKQIFLLKKGFNDRKNKIIDTFYPKVKKEKNQLLLLIDEFPSLGKMEIIENAMSYIAGYGLKCLLIAQSLKQFKKIYGKDNYILDNCSIQLFFTPNDEETPKMISDMFDSYTEKIYTESKKGFELMPSRSSSYVARKLMTPGEVRTLPYEKILLMITGQKPILGNKLFYFKEKKYTDKLLATPKKSDVKERIDIKNTNNVEKYSIDLSSLKTNRLENTFSIKDFANIKPEKIDEEIEQEKKNTKYLYSNELNMKNKIEKMFKIFEKGEENAEELRGGN